MKLLTHWKNKEKVVCFGDKGCALCAEGNKAKQRWLVEVWDRNEKKVKKFEFGAMIASQIKAIAELMAEISRQKSELAEVERLKAELSAERRKKGLGPVILSNKRFVLPF